MNNARICAKLYYYRHYRYEQKLACILWRIELNSLTMLPDEPNNDFQQNGKNSVIIFSSFFFFFFFSFFSRFFVESMVYRVV